MEQNRSPNLVPRRLLVPFGYLPTRKVNPMKITKIVSRLSLAVLLTSFGLSNSAEAKSARLQDLLLDCVQNGTINTHEREKDFNISCYNFDSAKNEELMAEIAKLPGADTKVERRGEIERKAVYKNEIGTFACIDYYNDGYPIFCSLDFGQNSIRKLVGTLVRGL